MRPYVDVGRINKDLFVEKLRAEFRVKQCAERERPPADVFVSYSKRDEEKARSICRKLKEAGIVYFVDEKDIEPGADLYEKIEQGIRQRKNYLLLLSEHSAASEWVKYEWAAAGGAGSNRRILRLAKDVSIPPKLAHVLADDDLETLIKHYQGQNYDLFSTHVFLRDILSPINLDEFANFRPVPGQTSAWEHQDVGKWPDEDQKRLKDHGDRIPHIARIEIRKTDGLPKLHLQCWKGGASEQDIELKGNQLTLYAWWYIPERANTEEVHPAFWCHAIEELIRLLDGKSILKEPGDKLNGEPLVSWWDLYPKQGFGR